MKVFIIHRIIIFIFIAISILYLKSKVDLYPGAMMVVDLNNKTLVYYLEDNGQVVKEVVK
jgi:hypothetical protein